MDALLIVLLIPLAIAVIVYVLRDFDLGDTRKWVRFYIAYVFVVLVISSLLYLYPIARDYYISTVEPYYTWTAKPFLTLYLPLVIVFGIIGLVAIFQIVRSLVANGGLTDKQQKGVVFLLIGAGIWIIDYKRSYFFSSAYSEPVTQYRPPAPTPYYVAPTIRPTINPTPEPIPLATLPPAPPSTPIPLIDIPATGSIKSIDVEVPYFRFYEGDFDNPPSRSEVFNSGGYRKQFQASETRCIYWEAYLSAGWSTRNSVALPARVIWYKDRVQMNDSLTRLRCDGNWGSCQVGNGYGARTPGTAWKAGFYQVDLYVEDIKVASGKFEVY